MALHKIPRVCTDFRILECMSDDCRCKTIVTKIRGIVYDEIGLFREQTRYSKLFR
jgi:hypothetical protein